MVHQTLEGDGQKSKISVHSLMEGSTVDVLKAAAGVRSGSSSFPLNYEQTVELYKNPAMQNAQTCAHDAFLLAVAEVSGKTKEEIESAFPNVITRARIVIEERFIPHCLQPAIKILRDSPFLRKESAVSIPSERSVLLSMDEGIKGGVHQLEQQRRDPNFVDYEKYCSLPGEMTEEEFRKVQVQRDNMAVGLAKIAGLGTGLPDPKMAMVFSKIDAAFPEKPDQWKLAEAYICMGRM
jgi:hypothetical protein